MGRYRVIELKCSEIVFHLTLEKTINEMAEKGWAYRGHSFAFEHSAGSVVAMVVAEIVFESEKR